MNNDLTDPELFIAFLLSGILINEHFDFHFQPKYDRGGAIIFTRKKDKKIFHGCFAIVTTDVAIERSDVVIVLLNNEFKLKNSNSLWSNKVLTARIQDVSFLLNEILDIL